MKNTKLNRLIKIALTILSLAALSNVASAAGFGIGNPTYYWFFSDSIGTSNGLPSGGSCTAQFASYRGPGVGDAQITASGQGDAFDNGSMFWVNGSRVNGSLFQPPTGNLESTVDIIGSLYVHIKYDLILGNSTLRSQLILNNPSFSAKSANVVFATNYGSDGSTQTISTSDGDQSITISDRWLITDDFYLTSGDPSNTTVLYGPGTNDVTTSAVSETVFNCAGTQGISATYDFDVPPGATKRIIVFQQLNENGTAAQTNIGVFDQSLNESVDLSAYMSESEIAEVVNWGVSQDADGDGILDPSDNCVNTANNDQADNDSDGSGDVCDADDDNDGVQDSGDNCPFTANINQLDTDGDGAGDACDNDLDGDGLSNSTDSCPNDPDPLDLDNDDDGIGDVCDPNDDTDEVPDTEDNCPFDANDDQADLDADGLGDVCDADDDADGVDDEVDNCPVVANLGQEDTDGDGLGDACDSDDDNDLVEDVDDNCPLMINPDQSDVDTDGQGDVCDDDLDGDGQANETDNCPTVANGNQYDWDYDGAGDLCDDDIDGDAVANNGDVCAFTPLDEVVDPGTGCSLEQLCPCDAPRGSSTPYRNHGKYVSCVAKSSESFVELGLITEVEKDAIVSEAAQSTCGDKK